MYFKKLKKVLLVTFVGAIISLIANFWIFELDWAFMPFPFLAGIFMAIVQNETVSYKFADKLVIGSLIFGFLTLFLIYIKSHLMQETLPFWPVYNTQDYLNFSLIFSFISIVGGLTGVVIKGFHSLSKKKK